MIFLKWAEACIKINLRDVIFWLTASLCIFAGGLFSHISQKQMEEVEVLLCIEDSELGQVVADMIEYEKPQGFTFTIASNRDEVMQSVIRGEAPCGFVFTEDFDRAVKEASFDGEVILYTLSGSLDGYLIKEIIYPYILTISGETLLKQYMEENGAQREAVSFVTDIYKEFLEKREVKIYRHIALGQEENGSAKAGNNILKMAFISISLLMFCLSIIECYIRNKRFIKAFNRANRILLPMEYALIRVLMLGIIVVFANKLI